uniref:Major facilitator superfamily (MFS) profile domain-containing protein n=1 Tax=Timema douglasi TaxID=61478 RepID=A0A7R8VHR9_TIMDO|nr:unnamed protein product [Timema douglasi]
MKVMKLWTRTLGAASLLQGILEDIKTHYNIGNDRSGLLQTAFVLSYMVFAPLFGYLGDRYSRKYIMAFGITLWSLTTLLGSFANTYDLFITSRALVGIGEASYSTIAPTIISDMFVGQLRSIMLALFYFAIPVGSGLGYIVGSETARATNQWQWGLRVTPIVGCVAVLLVLLVLKDPVRGESEGSNLTPTPWKQDIKQLARNKTFMLTTAGFTCVAFVTGALAWWGPTFIWQGQVLYLGEENVKFSVISYKFGIIAMVSGLIGVPLGSFIAQTLRSRVSNVDPLVCAAGMLISTPLLYVAMLTARAQVEICYTLMFLGELVLNLNWSIVADMVLCVASVWAGSHDRRRGGCPVWCSRQFVSETKVTLHGPLHLWSRSPAQRALSYGSSLLRQWEFHRLHGFRILCISLIELDLGCSIRHVLVTETSHCACPARPRRRLVCQTSRALSVLFSRVSECSSKGFEPLFPAGPVDRRMHLAFCFQYVVVPPRRSTAQAFQILVSHAFGDAGSPYLVGVISESIKAHYADSVIATSSLNSTSVIAAALNSTVTTSSRNWDVEFRSLQYALFMTCIVEVIGGAFFLAAAKYVVKDKATVDLANNPVEKELGSKVWIVTHL